MNVACARACFDGAVTLRQSDGRAPHMLVMVLMVMVLMMFTSITTMPPRSMIPGPRLLSYDDDWHTHPYTIAHASCRGVDWERKREREGERASAVRAGTVWMEPPCYCSTRMAR